MSQCYRQPNIRISAILLLLTSFCFFACSKITPASDWKPGDLVQIEIAGQTLDVELALTPAKQAKGLMKRKSMPINHGMLFVFSASKKQSFWMKNTWIPLDIAYINPQGVIQEIYPLYPNNQNSVKSYSSDIQFALETNQGWFKQNGIGPGTTINFGELADILKDQNIPFQFDQ